MYLKLKAFSPAVFSRVTQAIAFASAGLILLLNFYFYE
jgi:hypothetical protein